VDHPSAVGAVEAPGYLVRATLLHSDVKQGAFRARKNDVNERSAERHTNTPLIRIGRARALQRFLVAGSIGIISAVWRGISSVGSGTDGSSADADRHATAHGCATVSTAIGAAVINAGAANTNAPTAICECIG
jgi:hypothetical protein